MRTLREWIDRLLGSLRLRRRNEDLEEELRAHLELAAEAESRRSESAVEAVRGARLRAGAVAQAMDALRDQRGLPWLHAISADVVFGWRQLKKHRTASFAAILSLGLAIGATTAAFRLVDALLLRSLPVAEPDRLFALAFSSVSGQGEVQYRDDFDYPTFREYRQAAGDRVELMLVGLSSPQEIAFGNEPERAYRQYFSGNVFAALGLRPALGRLFGPADDVIPDGHPMAVISYDYWTRRFARNPAVLGTTFQWGRGRYEIIGVAPQGFVGTEPGRVVDFFVPAVMNSAALDRRGFSWFRAWVRPAAGVSRDQARQLLQPVFLERHTREAKNFPSNTPRQQIDAFLAEQLQLVPAGAGVSGLQRNLRRPLLVLTGLVVLVLLIACANVANLLGMQTVARTREMALRVSIGAGRWRLIRLVLIESAWLAVLASAIGALFAAWAAPLVVSLIELDQPVRLVLDIDWRSIAFGAALTSAVAFIFGAAPARRASAVDPLRALKGSADPHAHRRMMRALIGAQMAFCVFVVFTTGLFVATFDRLSNQPLGFSTERLVVLETGSNGPTQPAEAWTRLADHIRSMPGIDSAALAGWAPLTGNRWSQAVHLPGRLPEGRPPYFLDVSSTYFRTMGISMVGGRDFRAGESAPRLSPNGAPASGVGIVNETFARHYFGRDNPVGKQMIVAHFTGAEMPMEIVGLVADAVYSSVRDPVPPTVYVPLDEKRNGALMVRTTADSLALVPALRREVPRANANLRVANVATQRDFVRRDMFRERLLAILSSFFALVAVVLSAIGLYGVLSYSVISSQRELAIRMALGATTAHVVRRVTASMLTPMCLGLVVGLASGQAFARVVDRLLFGIKPTDPASLAVPLLILTAAAALAAFPPTVRAARIDPALTLRSE